MTHPHPPVQTLENLKAEIRFREKLAKQHVSGEVLLPNYYTKPEHDRMLMKRVHKTQIQMQQLVKKGVHFSPFVELGAERGQRSLVLCNDFNAVGIAADLSFHQLKTMEYFAHFFGREKLPLRVCCDANNLPFQNHAFSFAFCYQVLHHFPTPTPIIRELHRILAAGHFFFAEEPFERTLKLHLYEQKAEGYIQKNRFLNYLEKFISKEYCEEVKHGIIENDDIPLEEWIKALSVFSESGSSRDINLISAKFLKTRLSDRLHWQHILTSLLGGEITGLCKKATSQVVAPHIDPYDLLGCPNCVISTDTGAIHNPPLFHKTDHLHCKVCDAEYPIVDGIVLALRPSLLKELYPEFARSSCRSGKCG